MPTNTPAQRVLKLPLNTSGRDFCVGDIHGMYHLLESALTEARFDPERDRLISVGDLVDRGPDSARTLHYLAQSWFYAIRGNHEDMLIRCYEDPQDDANTQMWLNNGGHWWLEQDQSLRRQMYEAVVVLPLAIELKTEAGAVGIVHADIPPGLDWQGFISRIETGDEHTEQTALWSRTRARLHQIAGDVPGVTRIYCGHNIVDKPLMAGNVCYIDTGAYLSSGALTLINLKHPDLPPTRIASS